VVQALIIQFTINIAHCFSLVFTLLKYKEYAPQAKGRGGGGEQLWKFSSILQRWRYEGINTITNSLWKKGMKQTIQKGTFHRFFHHYVNPDCY
jgi:hypothetical protein